MKRSHSPPVRGGQGDDSESFTFMFLVQRHFHVEHKGDEGIILLLKRCI